MNKRSKKPIFHMVEGDASLFSWIMNNKQKIFKNFLFARALFTLAIEVPIYAHLLNDAKRKDENLSQRFEAEIEFWQL